MASCDYDYNDNDTLAITERTDSQASRAESLGL